MRLSAPFWSAALLVAPACGGGDVAADTDNEPLRRASFRSFAARAFLDSCPSSPGRRERSLQIERFEELRRLAHRKRAGHAMWLGENDWNEMSRHDRRPPCEPGEAGWRRALAAYSASLDILARRIAEYRP